MIPRILPFAAYLAFLALGGGIAWLSRTVPVLAPWSAVADLWLYPVKTAVVLGILAYYWRDFTELKGKAFADGKEVILALAIGLLVYVAWVRMDWPWAMQGNPEGYDPFKAGAGVGGLLAGVRIFGAAVVVPIMEEIFWRSFLIRYLISPRFETIRLGTFTPFSFFGTLVLFGLEHNLWLAGRMAGGGYTFLLYRTGRLWPCILAHATTNLVLGIHVLITSEWKWW